MIQLHCKLQARFPSRCMSCLEAIAWNSIFLNCGVPVNKNLQELGLVQGATLRALKLVAPEPELQCSQSRGCDSSAFRR
jgi:hypothetical protein